MRKVYAVVFGNYYPLEVDSLWETESLAERHADRMGDDWCVVAVPVRNTQKASAEAPKQDRERDPTRPPRQT